jgi:predicted  nucleic acid-binding Zn-ribbon protein
MKTSIQIQVEIDALNTKVASMQADLKKPMVLAEAAKIKRSISAIKKQVKEIKECLKVVESGITEQVVNKQIDRLNLSLKKYKECFTSLTDLATNQGWVKSKEYKKAVADLKKKSFQSQN